MALKLKALCFYIPDFCNFDKNYQSEKTRIITVMRALFIGFGNVGRKIAETLFIEKKKYPNLSLDDLTITGIFTRTRGALADPAGVNIPAALQEFGKYGKFNPANPQYSNMSVREAILEAEYDILVELSTLSVTNRGEPAVSYIRDALKSGKHVVSANKGPVAFAYKELKGIACRNKSHFLHEATVMDAAPVFKLVERTLKGCKVTGLSGILNSTTNFILSRMEKGESFRSALKIAQKEGFAEADPSHDIEGWDSAAKIAALANVMMAAEITPFDVTRNGISDISIETVNETIKKGRNLKLICKAWRENNKVYAKVGLEEIAATNLFSRVEGTGACLRIETDLMSPLLIFQESPTLYDTAYGVIEDIITICSAKP